MSVLRFFMLLSLVVWIGGIIFFVVTAPNLFAVLTRQQAGSVVSRLLPLLHWMGVISGVVYIAASLAYARMGAGAAQPALARHLLIVAMIALTLISQFVIGSRMLALRTEMGNIDQVAVSDARRVEFNRLHQWSTRLEGTVLVLGLVVVYLTARQLR
jgi:hypothetical protein